MSKPPNLLNDDGSASMATAMMMSHHAFRRDVQRFAAALRKIEAGDTSALEAVREEWKYYRGALHGHHQMEDARIFPSTREQKPELGAIIDRLAADHQRIDPLLEHGDRAFAELPKTETAAGIIRALRELLEPHLATEEESVVPLLREARGFPPPANDAEAEMYAQGFAWSSNGIAPEVLAAVDAMLPHILKDKLPAARAAFDEKCKRVWGSAGKPVSLTPVPDPSAISG